MIQKARTLDESESGRVSVEMSAKERKKKERYRHRERESTDKESLSMKLGRDGVAESVYKKVIMIQRKISTG